MAGADRIAATIASLGDIYGAGLERAAQARAYGQQQAAAAQARGMELAGSARAQGQATSGQIWGGTIAQLGQLPMQMIAQHQQAKAWEREEAAAQAQQLNAETAHQIVSSLPRNPDGTFNPEALLQSLQGSDLPLDEQAKLVKTIGAINEPLVKWHETQQAAKKQGRQELSKAILTVAGDGPLTPDDVQLGAAVAKLNGMVSDEDLQELDGLLRQGTNPRAVVEYFAGVEPQKADAFTLSEGQTRFGPDGQPIASVAKPQPAETLTFGSPTAAMVNGKRVFIRTGSDGKTYDMRGQRIVTEPTPTEPREAQGPQPGWQWVNRNGEKVYTNQPQRGDEPLRPAASTSETAQDRQRIARMRAAMGFLDRLNELREKINTKMGPAAGATGLLRRGGAAMGFDPDVAEYERERAAGGRALAVAIMGAQNLSDQDAKAWADMLPGATVDRETAQRLMQQVETMLRDSGATGESQAEPAATASVSVTAPNGKTYTFKSQADADAFKAKAGIK